jgi:hypothetical protein
VGVYGFTIGTGLGSYLLTYSGSQLTRAGLEQGKQQESMVYQYNSQGQITGTTRKDRRQLEQAAGGGANFPKRRNVQEPTEKTIEMETSGELTR